MKNPKVTTLKYFDSVNFKNLKPKTNKLAIKTIITILILFKKKNLKEYQKIIITFFLFSLKISKVDLRLVLLQIPSKAFKINNESLLN